MVDTVHRCIYGQWGVLSHLVILNIFPKKGFENEHE